MPKTTPCLWFDGQAEQAAQFYTSIFPNSAIVEVSRYGEAGPGADGSVMTVLFELDGQRYVGLNGGPMYQFNEAVSFQIDCADENEVDYYWTRLCDGGEEGPCGWLKDRFGLSWQVVPRELPKLLSDPDPARAQRAMAAMMEMKKLDIHALRAAADAS
jgi:predicted 3-demethylubiquinone-9 3-methyltransferase (glyoxalase superfamily)